MSGIIGTLLPFALGIAISPAPIIAAILLLTGTRGSTKGLAYLSGWLAGLATLVLTILLLISGLDFSRWTMSAQLTPWIIVFVGVVMLIMAYVQWHQRPPPDTESHLLEWLRTIPQATAFTALGAGLFFGLFSLKNLLLSAATAVVIGEANLGLGGRMTLVLIFVVVATIGIAVPSYVLLTQGDRARAILIDWECKLSVHYVTISCIVLIIIAAQLLGVGLGRIL